MVPQIRFKGFSKEWEFEVVGTYYDFKNGLNKGKEFFGFGVPIVNFTDVFKNRGIQACNLKGRVSLVKEEISNFKVKKGDVFFTRTSEVIKEIGYPSVMLDEPRDTVFSGFVLRARARAEDPMELLFKRYAFFTESFRSEMIKKSSMTTRALTSGTAIKQMEIFFPLSKKEQTQVGVFFEVLDRMIGLHQRKHEKLATLKKAMLKKMFPQNGATTPEIRFKGFPEPWEKTTLGEISNLLTGNPFESKRFTQSGVLLIRGMNVKRGYLDVSKGISEYWPSSDGLETYLLKENDIVIQMDGALIGTSYAKIQNKNLPALLVQRVTRVRLEKETCDFIYQYIQKDFLGYIRGIKTETAVPHLSLSDIQNFPIEMPSKNEQQKIGTYFRQLDELIAQHGTQVEKLKQIKAACLDRMFV